MTNLVPMFPEEDDFTNRKVVPANMATGPEEIEVPAWLYVEMDPEVLRYDWPPMTYQRALRRQRREDFVMAICLLISIAAFAFVALSPEPSSVATHTEAQP